MDWFFLTLRLSTHSPKEAFIRVGQSGGKTTRASERMSLYRMGVEAGEPGLIQISQSS